jgi:hypothetical protein
MSDIGSSGGGARRPASLTTLPTPTLKRARRARAQSPSSSSSAFVSPPPSKPRLHPCPVCGNPRADAAHVDACLDVTCPPSPPPSPPRDAVPIADWLGPELAHHAPALCRVDVRHAHDLATVPAPADDFLLHDAKIVALGARKKIAARIREYHASTVEPSPSSRATAVIAGR